MMLTDFSESERVWEFWVETTITMISPKGEMYRRKTVTDRTPISEASVMGMKEKFELVKASPITIASSGNKFIQTPESE